MLPEGKYNLELNIPGDGRIFLNFWDSIKGVDVISELKNGELVVDKVEVSIEEYIQLVISSINQRQP